MEITKLTAFIFSPTGTTAAVAKPLAEALLSGARIVDLTCADAEEERFGPGRARPLRRPGLRRADSRARGEAVRADKGGGHPRAARRGLRQP